MRCPSHTNPPRLTPGSSGLPQKSRPPARAYLCTRYRLDALDAEALINDAQLQILLHWSTLENPLAYLWQTLKHAVAKHGRRRAYERQQLMAYAQQRQVHSHGATRTAEHVAAVLERVAPRQQRLLTWYAQGYADTQVAEWLQTTPQAVRVARHGAYCALRGAVPPVGPPVEAERVPHSCPSGKQNFFGHG